MYICQRIGEYRLYTKLNRKLFRWSESLFLYRVCNFKLLRQFASHAPRGRIPSKLSQISKNMEDSVLSSLKIFFVMDFDKYSSQFNQLAILNDYTTEYVDSCLKYAKKLVDNNLPIIYDSEHFSELVGFKLSYIKTVVEYPKSFYWIYKIKKLC